jgi:hypothetical protein
MNDILQRLKDNDKTVTTTEIIDALEHKSKLLDMTHKLMKAATEEVRQAADAVAENIYIRKLIPQEYLDQGKTTLNAVKLVMLDHAMMREALSKTTKQ